MDRDTMPSKLTVYHVAGVATYPSTFVECRKQLERILALHGTEASFETLFPYGDYSRSMWRQIWEVRSDLTRLVLPTRIGSKTMLREIERSHEGGPILLIGHSGGGVAAYQTARMLLRQGIPPEELRVAQIGSPKVPVDDALKASVGYFYAVNAAGKPADPITRIGSWAGWASGGSGRVPAWSRARHAPGHMQGLTVIGGHTNYFRHQLPYVDERSLSNLDKTVGAMAEWLKSSYFSSTLLKG
ncbi:thioesterase domain-containing protein [Paenibacillus herberti]|uniref:Thioesterase domain-containing protein n=1 Tax=Paenibacillus herberti TaxID=1619309 RepID=A0A229NTI2_9BACL|nr:thioesterase domain-containing protein [Paenibacillus herberti]OXM13190.1 hypothetical protein CGZ75_23815 [Paenibacillus herberti]